MVGLLPPVPIGKHGRVVVALAFVCWFTFVGTAEPAAAPSGNGDSGNAAISWDGRFVAIASAASDLVPGDTNGVFDVFVRDRQLGLTDRVSVGPGATQAN